MSSMDDEMSEEEYEFNPEEENEDEPELPTFDDDGHMRTVNNPPAADPNPLYLTHQEKLEICKEKKLSITEMADSYGVSSSIIEIIDIIGDNSLREGLRDTPNRVIRSWEELYSGYTVDIPSLFTTFDTEDYSEMVLLKNIDFFSMCEHHMLPFYGRAHVAYIPHQKLVGLSKLARVVEAFSRRLQNQERLTQQIVGCLEEHLAPLGAACVIEGQHMCMACRGVNKPNAVMMTSCLNGAFSKNQATRAEFFSLIKG